MEAGESKHLVALSDLSVSLISLPKDGKIYGSLYILFSFASLLSLVPVCKDNDVHREEDTLHESIPNGQASPRDPSESDVAFREPLLAKSDSLSVQLPIRCLTVPRAARQT